MIFTKIFIIPIVMLIIVAGYLFTNPSVSGFFDNVKDRFYSITNLEPPVGKGVEFHAMLDNYEDITFDRASPVNISISGTTNATVQNNRINTQSDVAIVNYRGAGFISDNLFLNGTFEKLVIQDVEFSNGKIELTSNFSQLEIANMRLKIINMATTGLLNITNSSTQFSGRIEIMDPYGTFIFSKSPKILSIDGVTQKISIPSIGLNVG